VLHLQSSLSKGHMRPTVRHTTVKTRLQGARADDRYVPAASEKGQQWSDQWAAAKHIKPTIYLMAKTNSHAKKYRENMPIEER